MQITPRVREDAGNGSSPTDGGSKLIIFTVYLTAHCYHLCRMICYEKW